MKRAATLPNDHLRAARLRAASPETPGEPMSRQELAEHVNHWIYNHDQTITEMDGNYLGKLERGIIRWPQRRYREALRAILRADTDQDLGFHRPARQHGLDDRETVTHRDSDDEEEHMRRRTVLKLGKAAIGAALSGSEDARIPTVHLTASVRPPDSTDADHGISHEDLSQAVARAKHAYQSCRYTELITVLPGVLSSVDAVRTTRYDTETALESLRAQAYHVAASVELKRGHEGPAWLAADRSMRAAIRSGNPIDIASSARVVTHALMRARQFTDAATLASQEATRLAHTWEHPTPVTLSVYGTLLLRGAIAAAHADQRDDALTLLDEAATTARHISGDGNEQWTAFGPTNISLHRVHIAVVLGDAGTALDHARRIDLAGVPVVERRAAFLVDVARAHSQRGSYNQAVDALIATEKTAPEELSRRPRSHQLIRHILTNTTGSARLTASALADRVGVAA